MADLSSSADDGGCLSCGEGLPERECAASKRPCGHHCDHSWTHDACCWCGVVLPDADEQASRPGTASAAALPGPPDPLPQVAPTPGGTFPASTEDVGHILSGRGNRSVLKWFLDAWTAAAGAPLSNAMRARLTAAFRSGVLEAARG